MMVIINVKSKVDMDAIIFCEQFKFDFQIGRSIDFILGMFYNILRIQEELREGD